MHWNLILHIRTLLHKWVLFFKRSKTANEAAAENWNKQFWDSLQNCKHITILFVWENAGQQTADKNSIRLALIKTFFILKLILFFKQYGKRSKIFKNNKIQCLFKTYRISKQKVSVKEFIWRMTQFTVCRNIAWTTLYHTFFPFFDSWSFVDAKRETNLYKR